MSSYSEGQVHQTMDALEAAGMTAGHLTKLGQSPKTIEGLRLVLDGEAEIRPIERPAQESMPRLPSITSVVKSGLPIGVSTGEETFVEASGFFTGWIDPDFVNWGCNVPSRATNPAMADLHKLTKNGDFRHIFGGIASKLGVELDRLIPEQGQAVTFYRAHRQLLRKNRWLFVPFKIGDEILPDFSNVFVAFTRLDDDGHPRVSVDRFSYDDVWSAEIDGQFVVLQQ